MYVCCSSTRIYSHISFLSSYISGRVLEARSSIICVQNWGKNYWNELAYKSFYRWLAFYACMCCRNLTQFTQTSPSIPYPIHHLFIHMSFMMFLFPYSVPTVFTDDKTFFLLRYESYFQCRKHNSILFQCTVFNVESSIKEKHIKSMK